MTLPLSVEVETDEESPSESSVEFLRYSRGLNIGVLLP